MTEAAKTVLVMGASSGIGLAVTQLALERGYAVRALARSAAGIALSHPLLTRQPGDACNAPDVARALAGVDAVVQALGVPAGPRMVTGPVTLFSAATRVLLPAMAAAGVRRLITITGFGAGDSRTAISPLQRVGFMLVFGRAYADKDIQEQLIRASGLDWTLVRPGVLTNGRASGRYRVLAEPAGWRNGIIARADVADFVVRQIDGRDYVGKAPVLIG
jgi:putative NADH-flavin reductase